MDDKETAVTMAAHPKVVKELFLECTASFDYELRVVIDGRELRNLDPNVGFDGYHVTFYFKDVDEINIGSRVEITLLFWYKDKMVREFNGSTNVRRDEMAQATEHWTYMEDDQFHIDPEDVSCYSLLEMLKPEWHFKKLYKKIENDDSKRIIDVEFTEIKEEEVTDGYRRKQIELRDDAKTL